MMKRFYKILTSMAVIFMLTNPVEAAEISLPTPNISQSKMLTEMLNERHSSRDLYGNLTPMQLSKILWAANGITNRMTVGGTVQGHVNPAAMGIYAVDVYAVTADGIYLYNPEKHSLELVRKGDYRATTTLGQDEEPRIQGTRSRTEQRSVQSITPFQAQCRKVFRLWLMQKT